MKLIDSLGMNYPKQITDAKPGDVCIAYMFPRYSKVTASVVSYLKSIGVNVIIISNLQSELISEYGNIILPCATFGVSYIDSPVGAIAISTYLAIQTASFNRKETQSILTKDDILTEHAVKHTTNVAIIATANNFLKTFILVFSFNITIYFSPG